MNVHSLSSTYIPRIWKFLMAPYGCHCVRRQANGCCSHSLRAVPCGFARRRATGRWLREPAAALLRAIQLRFDSVLRHHRHWLRWRSKAFVRNGRRLPDKLPDCGHCTQNAQRVDHHFHHAPALLFRADQKRVCRFRFVVHNFKTPRSCRFV